MSLEPVVSLKSSFAQIFPVIRTSVNPVLYKSFSSIALIWLLVKISSVKFGKSPKDSEWMTLSMLRLNETDFKLLSEVNKFVGRSWIRFPNKLMYSKFPSISINSVPMTFKLLLLNDKNFKFVSGLKIFCGSVDSLLPSKYKYSNLFWLMKKFTGSDVSWYPASIK